MKAEWPQMMFRADGARRVFARPEDVTEGWLTAEHLAALDHDGDQIMGGSVAAQEAALEAVEAEIRAAEPELPEGLVEAAEAELPKPKKPAKARRKRR